MTELARSKEDPPMLKLLREYQPDLAAALPESMSPDRFMSIVINQTRQNTQLLNVEPMSLIAAVLLSAQAGLEPGAPMGLSWIIPRRVKGKQVATWQIGYEGLRQLAYRSGQVKRIDAMIVYEGDEFDYRYGRGGWNVVYKPTGETGRDWTHVFAVAETVLGAEMVEIMSKAEIEAHRDQYVKDWKRNKAWQDDEAKMARKTVLAKLARQLPKSNEYRPIMAADGSSPHELKPDLAGMIALEQELEAQEAEEAEVVEDD